MAKGGHHDIRSFNILSFKVLIFKYVENVPCSALVDKKMQNLCWVSKLSAVIYSLYGQKLLSFMNLNLMCKC